MTTQSAQSQPIPSLKTSVRLASTTALTATYSNGVNGVGATLTNSGAMALLSLDGVTVVIGDRVLIKDQASSVQNGIYVVTLAGGGAQNWVLTRTKDYDNSVSGSIDGGDVVFIVAGTINAGSYCMMSNYSAVTVGSSNITFDQFKGKGLAAFGNFLGEWRGDVLLPVAGGTGVNNSTSTITADIAFRLKDNSGPISVGLVNLHVTGSAVYTFPVSSNDTLLSTTDTDLSANIITTTIVSTPGSGTFVPANTSIYTLVEVIGSGGNGGDSASNGGGSGGGAGGYAVGIFTAADIAGFGGNFSMFIPGAAEKADCTIESTILVASPGNDGATGGAISVAGATGGAGSGSSALLTMTGASGQNGIGSVAATPNVVSIGGAGASSKYGVGGAGGYKSTTGFIAPAAPCGFGAGGGGGCATSTTGASGSSGCIVFTEFSLAT
jgi:hypothetical protein